MLEIDQCGMGVDFKFWERPHLGGISLLLKNRLSCSRVHKNTNFKKGDKNLKYLADSGPG